jgi:hypothetical protein
VTALSSFEAVLPVTGMEFNDSMTAFMGREALKSFGR